MPTHKVLKNSNGFFFPKIQDKTLQLSKQLQVNFEERASLFLGLKLQS